MVVSAGVGVARCAPPLAELGAVAVLVPPRGADPPHFLLHLHARHDAVRHLGQPRAHDHRGADGDPGRDADAFQQTLAHPASSAASSASEPVRCISWNPSATSASRASMHASASSPSVLMKIDEPHSAASIITPMMLLPFTVRSSLRSSTPHLKRPAVFTSSAAGRACVPSGVTILASLPVTPLPTPRPARPRRAPARA